MPRTLVTIALAWTLALTAWVSCARGIRGRVVRLSWPGPILIVFVGFLAAQPTHALDTVTVIVREFDTADPLIVAEYDRLRRKCRKARKPLADQLQVHSRRLLLDFIRESAEKSAEDNPGGAQHSDEELSEVLRGFGSETPPSEELKDPIEVRHKLGQLRLSCDADIYGALRHLKPNVETECVLRASERALARGWSAQGSEFKMHYQVETIADDHVVMKKFNEGHYGEMLGQHNLGTRYPLFHTIIDGSGRAHGKVQSLGIDFVEVVPGGTGTVGCMVSYPAGPIERKRPLLLGSPPPAGWARGLDDGKQRRSRPPAFGASREEP
ncbi:MAG: hypothetical protein GY937_08590 [bacterium]|nr:hypothetical protein [bacterium]